MALLVACSIPELDGVDKECPCARGLVCDEARNRCIEPTGEDAAVDATLDAPPDAPSDASTDVPREDAGEDASVDASRDVEVREDAPSDSGALDSAMVDSGTDCPGGAFVCTNFEEDEAPYTLVGLGFFRDSPGYMSDMFGSYLTTSGAPVYVEFNPERPLPLHARFWVRANPSLSIRSALATFGNEAVGELGFYVQVGGSVTDVYFGDSFGGLNATFPSSGDWTCVQLSASRTQLTLRINGGMTQRMDASLSASVLEYARFGLAEAGAPRSVGMDEIAVGSAPIPCNAL